MRKILVLFLVLFALSFVSATVSVCENGKYGIINVTTDVMKDMGTSVCDFKAIGFVCSSIGCSSVSGNLWNGNVLSSSGSSLTLTYPTILQSSYGYGVYLYKEGYIPYEISANWAGWGSEGCYNAYFTRKSSCVSNITSFSFQNTSNTGIVNFTANGPIHNAGPLNYIPTSIKSQYQTNVSAKIEVRKNSVLVYSENKNFLIDFSGSKNTGFVFPLSPGNYHVKVYTNVSDAKCVVKVADIREFDFVVPPVGCLEDWTYGAWSACINGQQTRTATDSNSCGTTINRSEIIRSCSSCTNGETRNNLFLNNYCFSGDVWANYSFEQCSSNSWFLHYNSNFVEECAYECVNGECVDPFCVNGQTRSCGLTDVGECSRGIEVCSGNQWGSCIGAVNPVSEVCDGRDNDCDGSIDEGGVCDVCTNGASENRACNNGQVGVCARDGTQSRVCSSGNWGSWGACSASYIFPGVESCNNLDDDCDGSVDESLMRTVSSDLFCYNGLNIGKNDTVELCNSGSWQFWNFFPNQFNRSCSGSTILEDQYCSGSDLVQEWSSPICSSGACDRDYFDNSTRCVYGCENDTCNPPTDEPTCSVDYLDGDSDFDLNQIYYINKTGYYSVHGYASANSEDFVLKRVWYNRTSPLFTIDSWDPAGSSTVHDYIWKSTALSDNTLFVAGNHTICCIATSQRCSGVDNCEEKTGDDSCKSFCIDNQNPLISINHVPNMSLWNSSVFNWNWNIQDIGCAGIDSVNVSVKDSNGSVVYGASGYPYLNLTSYGLIVNHSYILNVSIVDNAGNSNSDSASITIVNLSNNGNQSNCTENWSCDGWDDCSDGEQIRDCNDLNSCGTELFKPTEERSCDDDEDDGCTNCGGRVYFDDSNTLSLNRGFNNATVDEFLLNSANGSSSGEFDYGFWIFILIMLIVIILFLVWLIYYLKYN